MYWELNWVEVLYFFSASVLYIAGNATRNRTEVPHSGFKVPVIASADLLFLQFLEILNYME